MNTTATVAVPPVLRGTICANCGYSLEGIGSDAKCPECGRPQDAAEVVLYGWQGGGFREALSVNLRSLGSLFQLAFVYWALLQFSPILTHLNSPFNAIRNLVLAAIAGYLFAARRRNAKQDPRIQVRLYPGGCVQLDNTTTFSPLREFLWAHGWNLTPLIMLALGAWIWSHPRSDEVFTYWVAIVLTPFFGLAWYARARQFRAARKGLAAGAIVDSSTAYYAMTPWTSINSFTLDYLNPGKYRLQIRRGPIVGVVDADIALTDAQAIALRALIQSRISEAARDVVMNPRLALS